MPTEKTPRSITASYARGIVASLSEGVLVIDEDGNIKVFNQALLDMLGLPIKRDQRPQDVFDLTSELYRTITRALEGDPVRDEDIHYRRPDESYAWLRCNAAQLQDATQSPPGTIVTIKEVSDLKRAEREIWQVEKMSALGRLAASVAHEIGNPLGAIDIQLQLLQEDTAEATGQLADSMHRRLSIARGEMRRLEGIVQNFLRFSRPPALHLNQMDPNDLLRHIHALVAPEAKERRIDLRLDLADELPPIIVDENQLSQALLNILINAFQAVEAQPQVVLHSLLDHSVPQVVLEVRDNGAGISSERLEQIFEFYYTTKDGGTGLGLSIAQRIVHQHGGTLDVDSEEGEGTSVAVRLPCDAIT